jgi:hypothetical protein
VETPAVRPRPSWLADRPITGVVLTARGFHLRIVAISQGVLMPFGQASRRAGERTQNRSRFSITQGLNSWSLFQPAYGQGATRRKLQLPR